MALLNFIQALVLLVPAVAAQSSTIAASTTTRPVSSAAAASTASVATTTRPATTAAASVKKPPRLSYSATYTPGVNIPAKSEVGQTGTNQCGTVSNATSNCQNVYVNSVTDFCLWGPPVAGQLVGQTEEIEVAYCLNSGYGTRLFPEGTILGAHFVQTPDYVQVTGIGDFTKIGIRKGDAGGELDPHGATKLGNPIGGLVFSDSYGKSQQIHEWTNFMSDSEFCIRACLPDGPSGNPAGLCQHIYDVLGCGFNVPANYQKGVFEDCLGDTGLPQGVYGTSTFHQGDPVTPAPHPIPSSSSCVRFATITPGTVEPPSPTMTSYSMSTMFTVSTVSNSAVTFVASVATLAPSGSASGSSSNGGSSGSGGSSSSSRSGAQGTKAQLWMVGSTVVGAAVAAFIVL